MTDLKSSQSQAVPKEYLTPEQMQAHRKLNYAVRKGIVQRPENCTKCGINPGRASDGRSLIHGHHHDYSKPLDVEWLCPLCHWSETPNYGTKNGRAKLAISDVHEIRNSTDGCRKLGRRFGVNPKTICDIRTGKTWSTV